MHCKCSSPSWYMSAQKTFHKRYRTLTTTVTRIFRRVSHRLSYGEWLVVECNEHNTYSLQYLSGGGTWNRTKVYEFKARCSTIELYPYCLSMAISVVAGIYYRPLPIQDVCNLYKRISAPTRLYHRILAVRRGHNPLLED